MIIETIIAVLAAIGTVFLGWYFIVYLPRSMSFKKELYDKAEGNLTVGKSGRQDTIGSLRQ